MLRGLLNGQTLSSRRHSSSGDFWTDGPLLEHLRGRVERVQWDPATKQYLRPYAGMTKVGQARAPPLPHCAVREREVFVGGCRRRGVL